MNDTGVGAGVRIEGRDAAAPPLDLMIGFSGDSEAVDRLDHRIVQGVSQLILTTRSTALRNCLRYMAARILPL